ncbi:MAG: GntR family transcriptional regulator [Lachnospiraceae bacterium]|nr:GntR family transcriptional regulator [Lachnospiraceae bacterium]
MAAKSDHVDEFMPLRDAVFNRLRNDILNGELAPGSRLMEVPLAEKLGVSRTPIREAVRDLVLEGLVTMEPRKGARVAQITEKSMNDVLEVRSAFDVLCVELACERITEEDTVKLRRAAERFEEAVTERAGNRTIAQADVDFHNVIIRATGNDRLIALENTLSQPMYRYRYEYIKGSGAHDNLINEHAAILEAIEDRNKKAATEAARIHIENQKAAIIKQLRMEK